MIFLADSNLGCGFRHIQAAEVIFEAHGMNARMQPHPRFGFDKQIGGPAWGRSHGAAQERRRRHAQTRIPLLASGPQVLSCRAAAPRVVVGGTPL